MSDGPFIIEDEQPKKTFRIEGEISPTPIPGTNREIMFATQRNSYDCGPCIVLNTLQALGTNSSLSAVDNVRSYANQVRIDSGRPTLPTNGWFTNFDVDDVLHKQELNVKSWSAADEGSLSNLRDYLKELTGKEQEFVIYTGVDRHYKGLYRNGDDGIFELDSLRRDIPRVGTTAIETMISRASKSNRRGESISVASRPRFQIVR